MQVLESKLAQVASRLQARYRLQVNFSPSVRDYLLSRSKDVDSGARVLDHVIREELVPRLTGYVMGHLGSEPGRGQLSVDVVGDGFVVKAASAEAS